MKNYLKYSLLGLFTLTLVVVVFSVWVIGQLKSSGAYKVATEQLTSDDVILEATGGVKEYGWYVSGFIRQNSQLDSANLLLTVYGYDKNIKILCLMGKNENRQWALKDHRLL
ncbi:hypothetical protein [Catalinimonas niigatensis]|uniref:hypothetical protein n=1 Tax=Catalinimonas niigatensis TaxID=1397264 RepID=UPI002666400A|nr:hypothetical protein [Catalinimonas niigatensis]WPP48103.1 hypothetical protein PZB72_15635 [Catalinimonas niigatensis]